MYTTTTVSSPDRSNAFKYPCPSTVANVPHNLPLLARRCIVLSLAPFCSSLNLLCRHVRMKSWSSSSSSSSSSSGSEKCFSPVLFQCAPPAWLLLPFDCEGRVALLRIDMRCMRRESRKFWASEMTPLGPVLAP